MFLLGQQDLKCSGQPASYEGSQPGLPDAQEAYGSPVTPVLGETKKTSFFEFS